MNDADEEKRPSAVPWITLRSDIHEDPAVIGLCREVNLDVFAVIGRLHRFWAFADRQTEDGWLPHVNADWIDGLVKHPGFAVALEKVGWLEIRVDGVQVPNFDRWMGTGAKRRLKDQVRKRIERAKSRPHSVRKNSDKIRTRGEVREKRTGEVSPETPLFPEGDGFDEFWAAYPRKEGQASARREWARLKPDPLIRAGILDALSRQRLSDQWTHDNGRYVPHAWKYLRDRRWEDEPRKEEASAARSSNPYAPQAGRNERTRSRFASPETSTNGASHAADLPEAGDGQ